MEFDWNLLTRHNKPGEKLQFAGMVGSSAAFILARFFKNKPTSLVFLTRDLKEATQFENDLRFFLSDKADVYLFPPLDVAPYFSLSPNPETSFERLALLNTLTTRKKPLIVIAPLNALARKIIPRTLFTKSSFPLTLGDTFNREELLNKLIALGYQRSPLVEDKGTFGVRGGIIDIFSPAEAMPARIEFFGDAVESIRLFDPNTQKSQCDLTGINILPAREFLLDALPKNWNTLLKKRADELELPKSLRDIVAELLENKIYFNGLETFIPFFFPDAGTLFDYLPTDTVVCFSEENDFRAHLNNLQKETEEHQSKSSSVEKLVKPNEIFLQTAELDDALNFFPQIDFSALGNDGCHPRAGGGPDPSWIPASAGMTAYNIESNSIIQQKIKSRITTTNALEPLVIELNQKRLAGENIFIVAGSPAQRERLKDLLSRYKLPLAVKENDEEQQHSIEVSLLQKEPSAFVQLLLGNLTQGFYWPKEKQWWLTDEEIFGKKSRKTARKPATEVFSSFAELKEGDFIVHLDHGIGLYKGLINIAIGSTQNDFLVLEYSGGDKLYVPVDKLNRIGRYSVTEGVTPTLDKMGGFSWQKLKDKVKAATRKLARQLLEIQAARQLQKGYAFSPPDTLYEEFEATFPFEETPDQLQAIHDVLNDMQQERPMDRLVCGDVGYGKTEVAMRAAFKAIEDKKQTAILVPTTVLAFQHFETFSKRFKDYPVRIDLLCRFRSNAEQLKTVENIKNGKVDIVIGTHRLLSKDIHFQDLGLLVIDEEHRFGVAHKERMKKIKNLVDVLTLSATPIPRTLNFSLVGIRDLSLINTPPEDRLSIRTFVTSFDDTTIREAIMHELKRGGQIYFVHNRVQSIDQMRERLQTLVPEIKIGVGHGQMNEEELEEVMIGFMEKKFDLLLCTTIIESGLDIPNANTMIINRADSLGLAQLYQLRGRVGRSNHRAFCYLILPDESLVTDVARRRLAVIQKFTDLGSGFKIASHDLEIRGAGNILGAEQSGHIASMGYDLYVSLLKQAVEELQGKENEIDVDAEIKLDVSAAIPESLVPDTQLRLLLYKQASMQESDDDVEALRDEWIDRLGPLPITIENLLTIIRIKIRCRKLKITTLIYKASSFQFSFDKTTPIPTSYFLERMRREPKKTSLSPDGKLCIRMASQNDKEKLEGALKILEEFIAVIPA